MKKLYSLLILILLLIVTNAWATAPSRTKTYTAGSVIDPSYVTENEDNVFTYLQIGVDTIADGSIVNADVNTSAGIVYSKLNLSGSIQSSDFASSSVCEDAYPVGSIYLAVVSTNPATLLGCGTWTQIAQGQMLIGQKASDADFDTAEETGGAKTHTLTSDEMPAHTHTAGIDDTDGNPGTVFDGGEGPATATINTGSTGGGTAFSVMNPYLVCYIWKRAS